MSEVAVRLPEWRERLIEYVESKQSLQFEWGKHDCFQFAFGAAKAMTGVDFIGWIQGTYDNKYAAVKQLVKNYGHKKLIDAVGDTILKYGGEPVGEPGVGDIVAADVENNDCEARQMFGGMTLGISCGNDIAVFACSGDGIVFLRNPKIIKAWRLLLPGEE